MTGFELFDFLFDSAGLGDDYDVVHNGLIIAAVVVNHDDRTIELVTE